jgi:hypothetical protein
VNHLVVPAWGEAPCPLLPVSVRGMLVGLPAPACIAAWLGRAVMCSELDGHVWATATSPLNSECLREVADLIGSRLGPAAQLRPLPSVRGLGSLVAKLPLRTRTMNALMHEGLLEPASTIESLTLAELTDIRNFGTVSLLDLLCVVEGALSVITKHYERESAADRPDMNAMKIIAAWAVGEHGAETAGAVLELSNAPRPQEVEAAWRSILQFPVRDLAGDLAHNYSPPQIINEFLASINDLEKDVLSNRILPINSAATLDEIGRRHDVSRERVRQIEVRLKASLAALARSSVGRLATVLATRLGTAVPAHCQDVMALTDIVHRYNDPDLSCLLLLYLAGPYRSDDGWILRIPNRASLDETRQSLLDAADQSGLLSEAAVTDVLDRASIRRDWHDVWITRLGCLRRVGDKYLRWDGKTPDRLERLLRLHGKPATAEELLVGIDENLNARGIKHRLMEDPRFVRINKQSQFALPEWGFDEYTGITDEIAEEIGRCGGIADAEHLVQIISSTYGVTERSVRAYLAAPMFTRLSSGAIRLRDDSDEKFPVDINLPSAPDVCFTPDGWSLRVLVDSDVLRGSGKSISPAFAAHIGILPGGKVSIPGPESAITVSWPRSSITGPSVGSLRAEAVALGAVPGDVLFLVFVRREACFDTGLVRASDIEAAEGTSRLALIHGLLPAGDSANKLTEAETLTEIAWALGIEIGPADDSAAIVDQALASRRQDAWRSLIPDKRRAESLNEVLKRLEKVLG